MDANLDKISYPLSLLPSPVSGFINSLRKATDAPEILLALAGLAVLSVLAGNFLTIRGETKLNEYFVGIGRTGVRKTTAQKHARRLLKAIVDSRPDLRASFTFNQKGEEQSLNFRQLDSVTNFSVEGLEEIFSGSGSAQLLCPQEYKTIFDVAKRQAQGNTISSLVSFYDSEPISTTLRNKRVEIPNYSLVMLAVSTPAWFQEALTNEAIASGFLNRHVAVLAEMPENILLAEQSPDPVLWGNVVREYSSLIGNRTCQVIDGKPHWSAQKINFDFENDFCRSLWREYIFDQHEKKRYAEEKEADLFAREETHALKLAGLKAFGDGLPHLTQECLMFGIEWARCSSQTLAALVERKIPSAKDKEDTRLYLLIRSRFESSNIPTRLSDISKHFGGKQEKLHESLKRLVQAQRIWESQGFFYPDSIRPSVNQKSDKKV